MVSCLDPESGSVPLTALCKRWLVRHGKIDQARAALQRLTTKKNTEFNVEYTLAMMIHTNELEIQRT